MYFFFFFESLHQLLKQPTVIPNGAKILFAKRTATFINGPANLVNSAPKNPPDYVILDI